MTFLPLCPSEGGVASVTVSSNKEGVASVPVYSSK